MGVEVAADDPRRDDVRAALERHLAFARAVTPAGGVFALDLDGLLVPSVCFVSARRDGRLLGVGALVRLDPDHAELKSMHTLEEARRQGVARAIVGHLLSVAAARGHRRVSLETGNFAGFATARALYTAIGFEPCEAFGPYVGSPTSACMTMSIDATSIDATSDGATSDGATSDGGPTLR